MTEADGSYDQASQAPFDAAMQARLEQLRARISFGFPWWLRPFLLGGVVAITLGRRIYVTPRYLDGPRQRLQRLVRHELAHVRQVDRLGAPRFLFAYAAEFLRHFWVEKSIQRAYRRISFEIEANEAEEVVDL